MLQSRFCFELLWVIVKLRSKRESNSESTSSLLKRQPKANRHSDPESNPLRHSEALQKPKNPVKI
ncbi:hypothetical protein [Helicobacter fennelliae]|uniref:hypothetical protein n=1 Tax=Helicobacter fennelliae TaxID=215 RepID=UPI00130D6B70|nr:hypothetical protein [Helicobacter fennelliae]